MKTALLKEDIDAINGEIIPAGTKCELVEENATWGGGSGFVDKQDRLNLIRFEDKEAVVMNNQIKRI